MFDDGRRARSLGGPESVVLAVVHLLNGEQFLINEEDALSSRTCGPTLELVTSLKSYVLVLFREELNFLELVRLEIEFLFGQSPN